MIKIQPIYTLEVKGTIKDINDYNTNLFLNGSTSPRVDVETDGVFICTVCRQPVTKSDSISKRGKSLICGLCEARLSSILGVSSETILHLVHRMPCTIEINKCEQNMNKKDIDTGYQE